jgi:sulfotransferase family protein
MNETTKNRVAGEVSRPTGKKKNPIRPLYWLASYPKSGNTWTRLFLLAMLRENGNLPGEGADFEGLGAFFPGDNSIVHFEKAVGRHPDGLSERQLARGRLLVHEYLARDFPGIPMIKTHAALGVVHGCHSHNMGVSRGGLYLVRNPLDVCRSLASHNASEIDRSISAMAKVGYVLPAKKKASSEVRASWSQNVKSWTWPETPNILVLKYEDMVTDPIASFTKLVRHVGFPIDDKVIERAVEAASFANLQQAEKAGGFKEKPEKAEAFFSQGKAGVWRDALTPEQVRAIASVHATQMDRFGYLSEEVLEIAGLSKQEALDQSEAHLKAGLAALGE